MAKVVRVAMSDPRCLARPRHDVLRDVGGEAGEDSTLGSSILAGACLRDLGHEAIGNCNPP